MTFEELKVHINEEEDIKLIESKLTKVLSSKFENGTNKTEYYCGKCKKPHTYEVDSEDAYKVMLPEKCPECGQKISQKNDFSAFFIWRTAIVNGIKRFLVSLNKLRNEEFIIPHQKTPASISSKMNDVKNICFNSRFFCNYMLLCI